MEFTYPPTPSPFPSLPSSSFAFIAFHLSSSFFLPHLPPQTLGDSKVALGVTAHLTGTLEELSQPSPNPLGPRVPPSFWGLTLAISFPFLFMQM